MCNKHVQRGLSTADPEKHEAPSPVQAAGHGRWLLPALMAHAADGAACTCSSASSLDAASAALSLQCVRRNRTTQIPGTLFDSEKSFATLKALFVSRRVEYAVS